MIARTRSQAGTCPEGMPSPALTPPMHVVILGSGSGWYTDELCRAFARRNHTALVLPYERLLARLGRHASLSSNDAAILDADAVLARIIPEGSLEQIIFRVDALHWI